MVSYLTSLNLSLFITNNLYLKTVFSLWVEKRPWSRAWQPTPVFLPGEPPWTAEPGGLQPMGSQRVGRGWVTRRSTEATVSIKRGRFTVHLPCGSAGKESACNEGALGSILGLGRAPGEGRGYPLQYSSLENTMGYIVHEATESQTWPSHLHFHFYNSSVLRTKTLIKTWHISSVRSKSYAEYCHFVFP